MFAHSPLQCNHSAIPGPNFKSSYRGYRNRVGIGLLCQAASLCSLATQFQTRFPDSIPSLKVGPKLRTQASLLRQKKKLNSVRQTHKQGLLFLEDKIVRSSKTDRMPEFAVVSLVGNNILYAVEHHPEIHV
jgi:hypothetical protein